MHAATSKVENSVQVLSCSLKFAVFRAFVTGEPVQQGLTYAFKAYALCGLKRVSLLKRKYQYS
jgi:hypothetical protein